MKRKILTLLKKHTTWQLAVALILFWISVIVFAKLAGEIIEREPIRGARRSTAERRMSMEDQDAIDAFVHSYS